MIVRNDIQQNTEQWHELRHGKVGGSRAKGLFVNSDTLLLELLSEIVEDFEMDYDSYESKEMLRGTELEPIAKQKLIEYTGMQFESVGLLQSKENDLLIVSPDGLTNCHKFSCEIKAPGAKKHLTTIVENEIPSDSIHQCLHYFVINPNLEKHYFCSYRPENNMKELFVKELTRDSKINLGTKAKPNIMTIDEWVLIAKLSAKKLQKDIQYYIKQLEF